MNQIHPVEDEGRFVANEAESIAGFDRVTGVEGSIGADELESLMFATGSVSTRPAAAQAAGKDNGPARSRPSPDWQRGRCRSAFRSNPELPFDGASNCLRKRRSASSSLASDELSRRAPNTKSCRAFADPAATQATASSAAVDNSITKIIDRNAERREPARIAPLFRLNGILRARPKAAFLGGNLPVG